MSKIATSILCSIYICSCGALMAKEPLLSEMEILRSLCIDSHICERADISPNQQELLKALLKDSALLKSVNAIEREMSLRSSRSFAERFRYAESQFDAEVRERALAIVSEDQIKIARRILLLSRYRAPTFIFRDKQYMQGLGVLDNPPALLKALNEVESTIASDVRKSKVEMADKLFREFPEPQRQKIVNLVGNELYPMMQVDDNNIDSIPFDASTKRSSAARAIINRKELQRAIGLTDVQLQELVDNEAVKNEAEVEAMRLGSGDEIKRRLWDISQKGNERYLAVLTEKQRISICRIITLESIFADSVRFFERKEVVAYFGFSLNDQIRVRALTEKLNEEWMLDHNKSRYAMLCNFCGFLSEPAKSAILRDFDGVWNP